MPLGKSRTDFFFLLHFIHLLNKQDHFSPFRFSLFIWAALYSKWSLSPLTFLSYPYFFLTHFFPWTYHNSKLYFFLLFKNNAISQVRLPSSVRARTILFVHWCILSIQGTWQCCWNVEVKSSFEMFLGLGSKGILSISYFTILVIIKMLYTLK